jgi:MFS family permease
VSAPRPSEPARRLSGDLRRAGMATGRAARAGVRGVRSVTGAKGAGESGLARVLELHLVSTAADTLIVTALATTIFFAAPTGQARGRVALSLLVTMVPFALLAPVLGPLLDRVRSGRRYALATTMVGRAFFAWVMAGAVSGGSTHTGFGLYPAAFGFLVGQKAYLVTRAAAVPRVLPHGTGLVAANARISLAGVVAMALCAPLGAGLNTWVGSQWTLRLAFAVFAAGTALALALPAVVDSSEGEEVARIGGPAAIAPAAEAFWTRPSAAAAAGNRQSASARGARGDPNQPVDDAATAAAAGNSQAGPPARKQRGNIGPRVVRALRMNAALRAFVGFLTLFLAFRLRTDPLPGFGPSQAVAAVLVLAGVGGGVGTALGSRITAMRPERLVVALQGLVTLAAGWAAVDYGTWAVLTVAGVAGLTQALGKLCLDALIQRDVVEQVRTSAFARSETVLQLSWVVGGLVGLVLPLSGAWGLGIAGVATGAAGVATVITVIRARAAAPTRPTSP